MSLFDTRSDSDYRIINPRTVCRANKHSMLDPDNVWIKKSTGQRYCRACRKDKRQKDYQTDKALSQGYFTFGTLWDDEKVRLSSIPQLKEHKVQLAKKVDKLAKELTTYQDHLNVCQLAYDAKIKKLLDDADAEDGITGPVTD